MKVTEQRNVGASLHIVSNMMEMIANGMDGDVNAINMAVQLSTSISLADALRNLANVVNSYGDLLDPVK